MGQPCTKDSETRRRSSSAASNDPKNQSATASYRRPSHDDPEGDHQSLLLSPSNFSDAKIQSHLSSNGKKSKITRVVLTGGPCAGKSTALADLQKRVPQKFGLQVYCVPEAATMMVNGGLQWSDDPETTIEYQLILLRMQITLEDSFYKIAKASKKPSLIICDRGTMDGRVYCTEGQFSNLLKRGGYTLEKLRDERYDAVVHMVTAATGAEEHYNFDNPARMENVAEAKFNDDKLREMYIGHPKIRVIDNSTGFEKKLDRVLNFIGEVTGNHKHSHRTKRYFVKGPIDITAIPVAFTRVQLTITILNNSTREETLLVMKRQQGDAILYFYQVLRRAEGQPNSRHEHKITAREYANLLTQRDPTRVDVIKENLAFMYETLYCELGVFESPKWVEGVALMYVEPTGSADDEGYTPQPRGSVVGGGGTPIKASAGPPGHTAHSHSGNIDLDATIPSAAATTAIASSSSSSPKNGGGGGSTAVTPSALDTFNLENSLSVSLDSVLTSSPAASSVNGGIGGGHHHPSIRRRLRASIQLPPFLQIEKDISDDKYLSSFYVSHIEMGPEHARNALDAVRTTLTCDAFALDQSHAGAALTAAMASSVAGTTGDEDNNEVDGITASPMNKSPQNKSLSASGTSPSKGDASTPLTHHHPVVVATATTTSTPTSSSTKSTKAVGAQQKNVVKGSKKKQTQQQPLAEVPEPFADEEEG